MIGALDQVIRDLLVGTLSMVTSATQVRFQPPDESWRSYVSTLTVAGKPANAVNVYLFDVRENRKLRSNERRQFQEPNGDVLQSGPLFRYDCHYLISPWSGAKVTPPIEPTLDEHRVLGEIIQTLVDNAPLNPTRIYGTNATALNTLPREIREIDLPTSVLPAEGFTHLGDFWSSMGTRHRWRPAAYLIVTLPTRLKIHRAGPAVTTLTATYSQDGGVETLINIGGVALMAGKPVPGASVRLLDGLDVLQTTVADGEGRFRFDRLAAGRYVIDAAAAGIGVGRRIVHVPSRTGVYDVRLA